MQVKTLLKLIGLGLALHTAAPLRAQIAGESPELMQMIKSANEHLNKGSYDHAIALYQQAIRLAPDNIGLRKDLAYAYLLKREYSNGRQAIAQVLGSPLADEQVFQIAAAIEQAEGKYGKAKRIVNDGLKKYPNSGLLHNAMGNVLILSSKSTKPAIEKWVKGAAVEPKYPANYYNLAKTLFKEEQYVWTIIYAEQYVNLEAQSPKAVEMRKLLFEAYQKVFSNNQNKPLPNFSQAAQREQQKKLSFEEAFLQSINVNLSTVADEFTVDNLSMLRSRFLIYWHNNFAHKFPQSIITYQARLMKEGHYPAYNQWLFGASENSRDFSVWIGQFKEAYQNFERWKNNNPFLPQMGDVAIRL
ncbi:MAG TPA: hypothetical protein VKZ76_05585 [Edaphocola sp.]|nr:hypothetical protein [Edaphocola sp.]